MKKEEGLHAKRSHFVVDIVVKCLVLLCKALTRLASLSLSYGERGGDERSESGGRQPPHCMGRQRMNY